MLNDILTVIRKEFYEILNMRENRRSYFVAILVPVLILGIQFPIQIGAKWITGINSIVVWFFVPFFFISNVIADSFAGERERNTLETLLSSRLSEKSILLGKIIAGSCYSIIITLIIAAISLISVNIVHRENGILIFSSKVFLCGFALTILTATIESSIGIIVSLKAATVRQAQQTLGIGIMIVFFLPMITAFIVPKELSKKFFSGLDSWDMTNFTLAGLAFLFVVDVILFYIASGRFKRNKMLLD
jgi:ABC-2 type transport system permease protein